MSSLIMLKKQYAGALRQLYFVEQHHVSFLLWKLNVEKVSNLPSYKAWIWRSFYSRKKKSEIRKYGFLINLYLAILTWQPFRPSYKTGFINEAAQGWGCNYFNKFDTHIAIYHFINNVVQNQNQISLTAVTKDWLILKPKAWVSLPTQFLHSFQFEDFQLENYILLDGPFYGFQYKIICNLPPVVNVKTNKTISPWYLKVLFLRGLKYPVLLNYKYISLINNLAYFGQRQYLPWNSTLQPDGVWQLDPVALKILEIGKDLTTVYRSGEISEYLVKKRWKDLLNNSDKISNITQETLLDDSFMIFNIVQKIKKV